MMAVDKQSIAEKWKQRGHKVEEAPPGSWKDKPLTHIGRIAQALRYG
jgi:hypothetical protein